MLFTKSAFKVAVGCPMALYYYRNPDIYANQNAQDEFLEALAEGGFQVGALAKIYAGVTRDCDLSKVKDNALALQRTKELLEQDKITIAEAAFLFDGCFVRVDLLKKDGNHIDLIEVKAKGWGGKDERFLSKNEAKRVGIKLRSGSVPYLYDVAFQKYIAANALKTLFPGEPFEVIAWLQMADKSSIAQIAGVNQMFKIVRGANNTQIETMSDATKLCDSERLLTAPEEVNEICDEIIKGNTLEQTTVLRGKTFVPFVKEMTEICRNNQKPKVGGLLSCGCFKCPYYKKPGEGSDLHDGYDECWSIGRGIPATDFNTKPLIEDMNGSYIYKKRAAWLAEGKTFLSELDVGDIGSAKSHKKSGLDYCERDLVQTFVSTGRTEQLPPNLRSKVSEEGVFFDAEGLRNEIQERKWTFPLHMIDFETSASALPFYKGMHPYEQVAFQFSHHVIDSTNGGKTYTIRHAGQWINTEKGVFPNFNFVRKLKAELERDSGSVFRYSTHENTILNAIRKQLRESNELDKGELMAFIETITHPGEKDTDDGRPLAGPYPKRDMIDLCDIVKRFYWHPLMKGSNSIKCVLPSVLNSSRLLQERYSKPIYGSEIPSQNIPATNPVAWISWEDDGHGGCEVMNPYKHLPAVSSYFPEESRRFVDEASEGDDREDGGDTVANGGAALWAYGMMQFTDGADNEALTKALLRYCELDTLAMVFIWEYFNEMIQSPDLRQLL